MGGEAPSSEEGASASRLTHPWVVPCVLGGQALSTTHSSIGQARGKLGCRGGGTGAVGGSRKICVAGVTQALGMGGLLLVPPHHC